jgi:formiminoglutamate deiminase
MYELAARLDPDSYRELATCVYAEMLLAGWTSVGEFHYLHHGPGGSPYADPNEMTWSILDAAAAAGIRLTLLDTCYLQGDVSGEPLEGIQLRFSDGDGDSWSRRVTEAAESGRFTREDDTAAGNPARLGAAIHSVRAVGREAMGSVVAWAADQAAPIHFHVSEQRKENEACLAALQMTPTDLLASVGALSGRSTAVHATHLTAADVTRYGLAGAAVCACPSTEADLGDGVGPFIDLAEAGASLCLGSDSHALIDPFAEIRLLEWSQRLVEERRGIFALSSLLEALTKGGSASLGWPAAAACDSVTVRIDASPVLAGAWASAELSGLPAEDALVASLLFAARPEDVASVRVNGKEVVEGGEHVRLGSPRRIAERMSAAVARLLEAGAIFRA